MSIQLIRTKFKKLCYSWEDSVYQDFCEGLDVIAHGKSLLQKKKKGKEKNVSVSTKVGTELAAGTVTKGVLEMELQAWRKDIHRTVGTQRIVFIS